MKVVLATITLHNYLCRKPVSTHYIRSNDCYDVRVDGNNIDTNCMTSLERRRDARVAPQMARNVKDKFMTHFTGEGAIDWQEDIL